jgi:hypothetical protein
MVFTDQAPLHGYTDPVMLPAATYPTGSDPDFDAVWAFVPSSLPADLSVLLYFEGFKNWVTVDASNPNIAKPHWATVGPHRPFPSPNRGAAAGPKYGLDHALSHNPLVLVPEVVVPRHDPQKDPATRKPIPGTFDGNWGKDSKGKLDDHAALGRLVEDCFKHLQNLGNTFSLAPGFSGPPSPYLTTAQPADIKRYFLTGHSGGGVPLSYSATSTAATTTPTDLLLLDCTYGSTPSSLYVSFCQGWLSQGKLGPGAGNSRIVVVCKPSTDTEPQANDIRDQLKRLGLKISRPISVGSTPPFPALPTTDDMVELNFGSANLTSLSPGVLAFIQGAMGQFKAVFVKTNVDHDWIPNNFIPLICASGTVP